MRAIGTKAQRLLEAARTGDEPSAARIAALGERLFAQIGTSAGSVAPHVETPPRALSLSGKWIGAGVFGAVGVASVVLFVGLGRQNPSAAPRAPARSAPVRAPMSAIPTAAPASSAPSDVTSSQAPSEALPSRKRPAPSASPGLRLEEESALLAASQRALSNGELGLALSHLDRYDQRFPSGVLRTEAATARVIALCSGAAPKSRARQAAERFLARYPQSPARARITHICGL